MAALPSPRRALVALAACAAVASAGAIGCGGDGDGGGPRPPQGPSAARHGAEPLERLATIEDVRARLGATGNLVSLGRRGPAAAELALARRAWRPLAPRVRAEDPVLAREIDVAFDLVTRQVPRARDFEAVRLRLAPLATQLLDGAADVLLPRRARRDPGLLAEAMLRQARALERDAAAARAAAGDAAARPYALAFARLNRVLALTREIAEPLGPRRERVLEALRSARELFPEGAAPPPAPLDVEALVERLDRARAGVRARFALPG
jgi:hypothetical protein